MNLRTKIFHVKGNEHSDLSKKIGCHNPFMELCEKGYCSTNIVFSEAAITILCHKKWNKNKPKRADFDEKIINPTQASAKWIIFDWMLFCVFHCFFSGGILVAFDAQRNPKKKSVTYFPLLWFRISLFHLNASFQISIWILTKNRRSLAMTTQFHV